jgi:hypothetical protein
MTLRDKIARRLRRWPAERVFGRFDFLDLGPSAAVGMVLKRLHDEGGIRRVRRGYYDRPRQHAILGELGVSPQEFVAAVARRTGRRLQTHGATAANELHLTEQVPAQVIYETDGPSREFNLGKRRPVKLERRPLREMAGASDVSRLVFSGLRAIGRAHLTPDRVSHLRRELKAKDRLRLLHDLRYAPAWMHPYLRTIADETKSSS